MRLTSQKRISAQLLKCGENRVWFDAKRLTEVKEAITKSDIRSLIKELVIQKKPERGNAGFRMRKHIVQKRKGRRQGPGSRRGKKTARLSKKRKWINKIRPQRVLIKTLKEKNWIN